MNQEIKKILESHEERIKKLEENLEIKKHKNIQYKDEGAEDFKGLSGGINFLVKENFLIDLKSVDEIWTELKKHSYIYPKTSVTKILNVNFVNKKRILNRIKENGIWKYAIRK